MDCEWMDAWRVEANGPPESALSRQPVAVPSPGTGQALVDVRAAGLNFSDLLMIRGTYQVRPPLPFTPGQEVAGVVRRAGPDGQAAFTCRTFPRRTRTGL